MIAVRPNVDALRAVVLVVRWEVKCVLVVDEDGVPGGVVGTTNPLRALRVLWSNNAAAF